MLSILFMFGWFSCAFSASFEIVNDRIKGALVGSLVGDCFGHTARLPLSSRISTLHDIPDCYWLYDPFKTKRAPFSTLTVQSLNTLKAAIQMWSEKMGYEESMSLLAHSISALFFHESSLHDPHYALREHSAALLKKAEQFHSFPNEDPLWWKSASMQENKDAEVLMRSVPFGIVYRDRDDFLFMVEKQAALTDGHSATRAAAVTLAAGIAACIEGLSPENVYDRMVLVSSRFDYEELQQGKMSTHRCLVELPKQGRISDLPTEVHQPCEILACVTGIFLKNPDNLQAALQEALTMRQHTALIASLVGVLIGAHSGFLACEKKMADQLIVTEGVEDIEKIIESLTNCKTLNQSKKCNYLVPALVTSTVVLGGYSLYKTLY